MKTLIVIPVFFLFTSCATQFFVIESIHHEKDEDGIIRLFQRIVVSHPPKNKKRLFEIVEDYNRRTISYTEIMEYHIFREFYKETMFLTRKFKEGNPYPNMIGEFLYGPEQLIIHHGDADLLSTDNYIDKEGEHYFAIYDLSVGRYGRWFYKKIDNPAEYYLKE